MNPYKQLLRTTTRQLVAPFTQTTYHYHNQQLKQQQQQKQKQDSTKEMTPPTINKSEQDWKLVLTAEQFRILRQKGTETPGNGEYNKHKPDRGIYQCAGCSTPLYRYDHKFDSGCGWPAFFDAIPGAVSRHEDRSLGRIRTEITCTACGGHLGHVFKGEGFGHPTDERHCVNSISIKFNESTSADNINPESKN